MRIYILIVIAIAGFSCQAFKKNKAPFYAIDKSAGFVFVHGIYDQDTLSLKINNILIIDNEVFNNDDEGYTEPNLDLELRRDSIVLFRNLEVDRSIYFAHSDEVLSFTVELNKKIYNGEFNLRKGKHFLISYDRLESTVNRLPRMGINFFQYKKPLYFY